MAKVTGLGFTTLSVDNAAAASQDIKNDVTNLDWATPYGNQDITGVDKSAYERLALMADFSGTLNGVFNPSANRIHAIASGDLRVVREIVLGVAGVSLTNNVLLTNYTVTRAAGGELTVAIPFQLADGTTPTWA
jgi:hypothetical protein